MQLSATGKNKAQVMPAQNKMSKKKKAAIIGGSVGAAVGAWGIGGTVARYIQDRKQSRMNDAYDQEMADKYKEIEPFTRGNWWKGSLKDYYGESGGFHEGESDMGVKGVGSNTPTQIGPSAAGAVEEEFFDAMEG
jgi:hypothetical protein